MDMKEWNDDKALFSLIKEELYTAVIGDIMDKMGYTRQFLPPQTWQRVRRKSVAETLFRVDARSVG